MYLCLCFPDGKASHVGPESKGKEYDDESVVLEF